MKNLVCLNCNEAVEKNYCSNCGQKTDTHRINFKHFLIHDILHGVWHVDKGILFTIKEALTRPGEAALDYISGKRVKYYNVFYLIVILVGLQLILANYYEKLQLLYHPEIYQAHNDIEKYSFLTDYSKILILALIPLFAVTSYMLFRRKKLNISEHFILSGMIFLGVILISLFSLLLSFIDFLENFSTIAKIIDLSTPFILFLYISFGYYKPFKSIYKPSNLIWRVFIFDILLLLEVAFFLFLLTLVFE
ncbi:DUF3667 domain-containing protein [Flavobacterium soli]|uniref:DUF3667 domain-containing protein n=1 Tax=Flavobacterium soli TaxID=344881 RepID=UPI00040040E7|nr:DUF3667 domain-containing protein [Flavobacterium soli]